MPSYMTAEYPHILSSHYTQISATHLCALAVGTNSEPPVLAEPLVATDVIYLHYGH
jgi:hypothetical protein